jgi:Uncharacterised nucleotidyltransferase
VFSRIQHPEIELILCCARTHITPSTAERIKTLLQQDINWNYLIKIASRNGIVPILSESLKTIGPEALPKDILSQLRNASYTNAQNNLLQTAELLKLLKLFEANKIPVIPFKGPVLTASVYGNLALRQFGDLDILVQEQDVSKAIEVLISQGYILPSQLTEVDRKFPFQVKHFQESQHHQKSYNLVHQDRKVIVELHWLLTQKSFPFPLDFQHLWKNSKPLSIAGTIVPQFSPEDRLLYLCMHGAKHTWTQLKWICDIAEILLSHQTLNWEQVMSEARRLGSDRMLRVGLFLTHELLGSTLPDELLSKINSDRLVKLLCLQVYEWLFEKPPTEFEVYRFRLQVRERWADKIGYFLHLVITPTKKEWLFLPVPKSFCFIYYVVRPIRLIWKYILAPLNLNFRAKVSYNNRQIG